jgi:hypothetical protein
VLQGFRTWLAERKERKRLQCLARYGEPGQAELQDLIDQQSPVKGKWGFFPK